MSCSHTTTREWWVPEHQDDMGYWVRGQWHYDTKSTCVDIDLHRFKCTRCGEIGYYSGAARAYHEDGVKSDIEGLGGKP